MKKIFIGLLLVFLLHKSAHATYTYYWWSAEATQECRTPKELEGPKGVFECIYRKMGPAKYLQYILISPDYTYQEWQLRY